MFDSEMIEPLSTTGRDIHEPVDKRLKRIRDELKQHLLDIETAIELLEKQPQLLETLNLLRKVGI